MEKLKRILIETDVDKLLEIIDKKKEISVEEASNTLGIPENIVEEWSEILSKNKMIKIKYEIKGTILRSLEFS
ncbi:MAG: hypothetical protein J7L08_04245, partial [Candidatus Aenigmarchaeota archaeon]|nr:hypothetical protein [Candidatus Aenigmarchaeota archaeon]